jgi:hypothetical protein
MFSFFDLLASAGAFLWKQLYDAATKIIFVGIVAAVWTLFVEPYADDVKVIIQWFFNQSLYRFLPFTACQFMAQVILFLMTYKIFLWIFSHGVTQTELPQAQGFASHRV